VPDPREPYGRLVHDTRLACEAERAATEGRQLFNLGAWEERDPAQRELDMRIGAAVAAAERDALGPLREALRRHLASFTDPEGVVLCGGCLRPSPCPDAALAAGGEPQERSDEKEAGKP
jgi:hypothetical protein